MKLVAHPRKATRRDVDRRPLVVLIFLILAAWYVFFAVERYQTSHLYGDEPEYLFVGQSVWNDGDLDLRNEFENPDPRAFPAPLTFKLDPAGGPSPANFIPTVGVFLTGPAYSVGGLLAVYLLFAAMNLAALFLMFSVLRRLFPEPIAAITVAIAGLSVPLAWHAASLWSEVPALLLVSAVLALSSRVASGARPAATAVAMMLAAMPWLHQKYFVLAAGLAVAVLLLRPRQGWRSMVLAGPLLGLASSVAFSYVLRERWNFTISGTTEEVSTAFNSSLTRFLGQPVAWFFDQTRGWLPLAPAWVLAIVGFAVLLRFTRGRGLLVLLAVAFVPYFVVYFWGPFLAGDSPPARETLPALPAFSLLLAAGINALRGVFSITVATLLAGVSVVIGTISPVRHGFDVMFNNVGRPKLLDAIGSPRFAPAELWPQMTADPNSWSVSTLLMVAIATGALAASIYYSSKAAGGSPWTLSGDPQSPLPRDRLLKTTRRFARSARASRTS